MRTIERTSKFKRDYKRESRGQHGKMLDSLLTPVLAALADDQTLAASLKDHALTGNWRGFRECHIKPDLLIIYRKPNPEVLELARLGSHAEIDLA